MHRFFQCLIVGALAGSSLANAADLSVDVAGLRSAKGKVLVGVYSRADDFLELPMRTAAVDAQAGKVRVVIAGLAAGDYALSVFQNENGNGKRDTNPVGMPIEPYGSSNDAAEFSMTGIACIDVESGRVERFEYGPDWVVEEHIPVPKASKPGQWLVGVAYDVRRQQTVLSVFDGAHVADGPVAQARLPYAAPLCFHGNFLQA